MLGTSQQTNWWYYMVTNYQAFSLFITTDTKCWVLEKIHKFLVIQYLIKGSIDDDNYGQLSPDSMAAHLNSGYASTINLTNVQYTANNMYNSSAFRGQNVNDRSFVD